MQNNKIRKIQIEYQFFLLDFFYIEQLVKFPAFANARTIKVFLNQLLAYQAVRVEDSLVSTGTLIYDDLVTLTRDDFKGLCAEDFINIIGSEQVKLLT